MNNTALLVTVAVLAAALGAAGVWIYQERSASRVEVTVGGRSLTLETR